MATGEQGVPSGGDTKLEALKQRHCSTGDKMRAGSCFLLEDHNPPALLQLVIGINSAGQSRLQMAQSTTVPSDGAIADPGNSRRRSL